MVHILLKLSLICNVCLALAKVCKAQQDGTMQDADAILHGLACNNAKQTKPKQTNANQTKLNQTKPNQNKTKQTKTKHTMDSKMGLLLLCYSDVDEGKKQHLPEI
jgi:hypothetical protein